jgi:uncharacterized DUF497 family protein
MKFEWDESKAAQNLVKHGVPFEFATRVFLDPERIDTKDARRVYGEERRITLGRIDERLYAVVYTVRSEAIRLISARKANDREESFYEALSS